MSVQIKKQLHENLERGLQMHMAMRVKAEEMIEMMKKVKADARKRAWQYELMIRASKAGKTGEVKRLFADMQTWRRYKIN